MWSDRASLREYERRYGVSRAVLAREIAAGRLHAERIGLALAPRDADVRRVVRDLLERTLGDEAMTETQPGAALAPGPLEKRNGSKPPAA